MSIYPCIISYIGNAIGNVSNQAGYFAATTNNKSINSKRVSCEMKKSYTDIYISKQAGPKERKK